MQINPPRAYFLFFFFRKRFEGEDWWICSVKGGPGEQGPCGDLLWPQLLEVMRPLSSLQRDQGMSLGSSVGIYTQT